MSKEKRVFLMSNLSTKFLFHFLGLFDHTLSILVE
jgi:hypothetical protein